MPHDRLLRLIEAGQHRTAIDEILHGLRHDPKNDSLLNLGLMIASGSRSEQFEAAEPVTESQRWNALLAPVATECSSCHKAWYSDHSLFPGITDFRVLNPVGLQCQICRYTRCRNCFSARRLSPDASIDMPRLISESCPKPGHGELRAPVLPTGRSDSAPLDPDRIEAVIITREGPIPPTMDEALEVVTYFFPLIADDAPLIHICASRPGLMADENRRDELALTRIHDLEREGKLESGAWSRSKRIFVKVNDAPDTSYLLTMVRKEAGSREGNQIMHGEPLYKRMEVVGVRINAETDSPLVLLKEAIGDRCLAIRIGAVEATALEMARQGLVSERPLTHELIGDILEATGVLHRSVKISSLRDEIFMRTWSFQMARA